jgi:hypothetical protein
MSRNPRIARAVALVLFAGMSTAAAEPIAPLRVQTVQIESAMPQASPATFPKVHTLSVRPGYPGEPRDTSGRPLFTPQISDGAAFDVDPRMVSSLHVELGSQVARNPDRHFIHTIRIPAEAAPQDAIEASAALQRAAPTQGER